MKFKAGDKVRFLNESIEGFVSRVLSQDRVEVTDSHGFKHDSRERDLVLVEFGIDHPGVSAPEVKPKPAAAPEQVSPLKTPATKPALTILSSLEPDETIYAAIRLKDERQPLTSDLELWLVNNTGYVIVYTLSKELEEIRSGLDAGILQSRQEKSMGIFTQDELHRLRSLEFQFLLFNFSEYQQRPPLVRSLKIDSAEFLDSSYRERLNRQDETVLMMPLAALHNEPAPDIQKLMEKYRQQADEEFLRTKMSGKGKHRADKFVILSREKVVDLHIEELLKDYSDMSNAQIISYQINFFMYELDQAIVNKFHKIVFIHGVGEGILKSAIREELKKYPNLVFRDAPAEKFGYGATEVEFI